MSYYFSYYLGYEKDGRIYPLGVYDCEGKIHSVISRSASYASDLHYEPVPVPDGMASEELRKEFMCKDIWGNDVLGIKYMYLDDLPSGDFVKSGYCLEEDVEEYLGSGADGSDMFDLDDIRYNMLTPDEYAAKAAHELKHGRPKAKKDEFGEVIPVHSCKEYMYFMFPDYYCAEWEAYIIRTAALMYEYAKVTEGARIVVLMTEG